MVTTKTPAKRIGVQLAAARKTLAALKPRITNEHASLVAQFEGLAQQIDKLGVDASSALWKELGRVEAALRSSVEVPDDGGDDESGVGLPAPLGN